MTDEDALLRCLLKTPADDVARLVYADWLDERGEAAKAEFLRLEANDTPDKARLQELAADLDTKWLAVVGKMEIERCGQVRQKAEHQIQSMFAQRRGGVVPDAPVFEFVCPQEWEGMAATDDLSVRFCTACRESVYYCDTIVTARGHAVEGHCVVVDLGIIRNEGDLGGLIIDRSRLLKGRMLPLHKAAREIDPVSEQRERAKQHSIDPAQRRL